MGYDAEGGGIVPGIFSTASRYQPRKSLKQVYMSFMIPLSPFGL
jgi:hypothetical protein